MEHPSPDPLAAVVEAAAATHRQRDEYLYSLGQRLRAYDGVTAEMRDDRLEVAELATGRRLRVACVPRESDGGRLWLSSGRIPIAPAGSPDAPLLVVRRLREGNGA